MSLITIKLHLRIPNRTIKPECSINGLTLFFQPSEFVRHFRQFKAVPSTKMDGPMIIQEWRYSLCGRIAKNWLESRGIHVPFHLLQPPGIRYSRLQVEAGSRRRNPTRKSLRMLSYKKAVSVCNVTTNTTLMCCNSCNHLSIPLSLTLNKTKVEFSSYCLM